MENLEPKWDLIADTNSIKEGQATYFRLQLSKSQPSTLNDDYVLQDGQYLEITFNITGTGETLEERDFNVLIGESTTSLVLIGETETSHIQGKHVTKLSTKDFHLNSGRNFVDAFFFKIECPQDGIWDGTESLSFNIESINEVSTLDGQIANTIESGVIGISTQVLNYNTDGEIWLTPDLSTHGDNLYTIGGIGYGAESRLFIQAFGQSKIINGVTNIFMPSYEVQSISMTDIPSEHITGTGTILVPDESEYHLSTGGIEESSIMIRDNIGNIVQSGLKFNTNGQFVQTFIYDSLPVDAYFRAVIRSIKNIHSTDAYYIGKRFRAYNIWICPDDVTDFSSKPTPGHLYQLRDTKIYPYVVKDTVIDGITKILFEEDKWYDLGLYNESLGTNIIGSERMFRIVVNDDTGTDISFETDSNLGEIHVGEYFGHTVYPKIVATGSELISYTINSNTSPNDITKYGLDLTADGLIVGEAYASSTDFSANDDIPLQFDVTGTGKNGKSLTQRFKIRIIRGLGQNFLHADICPSLSLEREWFRMISTTSFSRANYYRASDPRYGVNKVPRILMKENFVDPNKNWEGIKKTISNIRNNIIDTVHGAPTPDGSFRLVLGNYKLRSALDNQGNVLYDVLYRELHSVGTQVDLSLNPSKYTDYSISLISEIYGLRQNVYNVVGEDTANLLTSPSDLNNRGVEVDPINGLSVQMLDTVPRYMNHPYIEDNIKPMYFPCIPVAYLQPGQGEAFFNTLIQNNEHGTLLNTEFEVSGVEFSYFVQDNERYVQETFIAPLRVPDLFK